MSPGRVRAWLAALVLAVAPGAWGAPFTRGQPFLWRVERDGSTSYLFGTCHVPLDLEKTLQPPGIAALDGSRRVFVELDMSSLMTVVDLVNTASTRAQMPGRSLRALLPPPLWRRLVDLHEGHLGADALDHMKPWSAAFTTYQRLAEKARTKPRPRDAAAFRGPILDLAVTARAKERGIPVGALETPLDQIQVFNGQRLEDGIRMLTDVLEHPEASDESPRIVDACLTLDERVICKEAGRLMRRNPNLHERLLVQRNRAWAERLDRWLPDGGMFVAVGAAHMYGSDGLVALLRRRGYAVSRVPPAR